MPQDLNPSNGTMSVWVQLIRTYSRILRQIQLELSKDNLSVAQFEVMAKVNKSEGMTQQTLAESLLVTKGNICGLVDRLTESQFLERRSDPEDRRVNRLYLTPTGKALVARIRPKQYALIEDVMAVLTAEEQTTLHQLLQRLHDNLESP